MKKWSVVSPTAAFAGLWTFLAVELAAEGFRNPPPGTFNLGRAGGRIAHIDDSSAIAQNPANLTELKEVELQLSPSVVYIAVDYTSPNGSSATTKDPWKLLPNFFASVPIKNDKFAAGLGITTPYGLSNEWDPESNSPLRYTAPHYTELKTINFNPTVAVRLCKCLTVGAGLDVVWSELTLKQYLSPFVPDFEAEGRGDGLGFGGNLGITWQVAENHRVAVTLRSPFTVDYGGDFTLHNAPPTGSTISTSFDSRIEFPLIIAAGYGIQLTERIRLEANFEWLQFSRFESLPVEVGDNPFVPSTTIRQDWKDTFTIGIGGDWRFAPGWVIRAGYQFYESPVPDSTLSPTIPDANQNVLTVGLGYRYKGHSFEFAYGYDIYDQRHIDNNQNLAFNGDYDITVHLLSFAYRFRF